MFTLLQFVTIGGLQGSAILNAHGSIDSGGCSFSVQNLPPGGPVSGSCSGPYGGNGAYAVIGSELDASAYYNSLKAYASQDIFLLGTGYTIYTSNALATAFVDDNLTASTLLPLPIYVTIGYTVRGAGNGSLTLDWGSSTCVKNIFNSTATCSGTQLVMPGQTFNLQMVLTANASIAFSGSYGNRVSDTADYSHTAILTQFSVYDQNMNPLTGVQLVSDSGFDYQSNVLTFAPEPGSFWLFLVTAVIAVAIRALSVRRSRAASSVAISARSQGALTRRRGYTRSNRTGVAWN